MEAVRNGGVSLPPMPSFSSSSQHSRKEWHVVAEQSVRNPATEELERSKFGQSDERLIYEVQHGRVPLDVDFRSASVDGVLDNDILQQRLHATAKQRGELQNMEIQLRAQVIARSEIARLQNAFDAQIKEHANATAKLQGQQLEKEQMINELERMMDEKERELNAIRVDNEAAWAKEDLLREQNKELQSYRREMDTSEAERAQHIKQIHDLQEHIQEKERQFIELQEQHRIDQETIHLKDEQMKEAQAWIARAQEISVLQTANNHTLQAELRERIEQYNHLWLGCQRQFGEMEKLHLHSQQLQLEIADAREKSGNHSDVSRVSHTNSIDASQLGHVNDSQLEVNDPKSTSANTDSLQNGNSESSGGGTLTQTDHHVHGVAFTPPSLFGMPTFLPTTLHPFAMPQGVLHPSHVQQSPFQSLLPASSIQNWQSQQGQLDGEHKLKYDHNTEQTEENSLRADSRYNYEASEIEQVHHANYVIPVIEQVHHANVNPGLDVGYVIPSPNRERQVHNSIDESHDNFQSKLNLQQISSQLHEVLRVDSREHFNDSKEMNSNLVIDRGLENKITAGHSVFAVTASSSEPPNHAINASETSSTASSDVSTNAFVSVGQKTNIVGKPGESHLLDERALLAAIARTIGSDGRIRISSTLPNRLGKMLAPLHWHDYKTKYGKVDDFVASHPDLFLIEGDYIQLREGAQRIITATAAAAKVAAAAAAAAPSSFSQLMPSVALTPMAQSQQLKKLSAIQRKNLNDDTFHVAGGVSNVKILSKSKDGATMRTVRNGSIADRTDYSQNKVVSHERPGMSLVGRRQSRTTGAASSPKR
ncbi:hypothetical protein ACS0TY_000207 [Phlomoides rotata]